MVILSELGAIIPISPRGQNGSALRTWRALKLARWQKLLRQMLLDERPVTYTYGDAATVLTALGFEVAPHGGGSHRRWRRRLASGNVVIIGLVEKGNGTLKPYLIRDLIAQLRANDLVPADLETP